MIYIDKNFVFDVLDQINRMVDFHKNKLAKHSGDLGWNISHGLQFTK